MRYQSNLTAPDLRPHFKLCNPIRQHGGHDAPSDPDYDSACLYHSDDEAALLFSIARRTRKGLWVDIGTRFGWSAAHVAAAGHGLILVDPHFDLAVHQARMEQNLDHCWDSIIEVHARTWRNLANVFAHEPTNFDGFVIDGCHDAPEPLLDVQDAHSLAARNCVIMLHDGFGDPVREAAKWLMVNGWKARFYFSPNGVIAAWRGGNFTPPDHVRDPAIDWSGHEKLVYGDISKGEWA